MLPYRGSVPPRRYSCRIGILRLWGSGCPYSFSVNKQRNGVIRLKPILLVALTTVILLASSAQAQQPQWTWKQEKAKHYANGVKPKWMPQIYWAIIACETPPGRWDHNSGTYQGAFGFYHGTWDSFKPAGYPAEAYQASAWQQYQVAKNVHARYGFSGWGCYTHGGYRYHM